MAQSDSNAVHRGCLIRYNFLLDVVFLFDYLFVTNVMAFLIVLALLGHIEALHLTCMGGPLLLSLSSLFVSFPREGASVLRMGLRKAWLIAAACNNVVCLVYGDLYLYVWAEL